jgi:zinc/manganese transport system substrate-binding protein
VLFKVLLPILLLTASVILLIPSPQDNNIKKRAFHPSIRIVTSFSILKDLVKKITTGNKNVQLGSIVPVNADPHTYQPTPQDSKTLATADLIFINGLDFEKNIEKLIISSGFKGKVYSVSEGIPYRQEPLDPHLWHDVKKAKEYVINITKALCEYDPQNQDLYQKNKEDLLERLDKLDKWVKQWFEVIPLSKRQVVTTHDAFWYFGQAYGIQFLSPVGISTELEASAQMVANLIQLIKDKNIKAVFVENLANPKQLQLISEETEVGIKGSLYADSLSELNGEAATYEGMIVYNVRTICQALESGPLCPVPF